MPKLSIITINYNNLEGLKRTLESVINQTWQEFEYRLAVSKLSKNGILVSDDIDASPAWAKVSSEILKNPWAIFDARKVIGIAHKKII